MNSQGIETLRIDEFLKADTNIVPIRKPVANEFVICVGADTKKTVPILSFREGLKIINKKDAAHATYWAKLFLMQSSYGQLFIWPVNNNRKYHHARFEQEAAMESGKAWLRIDIGKRKYTHSPDAIPSRNIEIPFLSEQKIRKILRESVRANTWGPK